MKVDKVIYETTHFLVATIEKPHIDRKDGGHIVIICKNKNFKTLTDLPLPLAFELIDLAKQVGKVMINILQKNGVDIEMINYQINGNWSVKQINPDPLHLHLYGRAKSSIYQKYGDALYLPQIQSGFYNSFKGLLIKDIQDIQMVLYDIKTAKEEK